MNPPDPEPMMALDKFAEQIGLSKVTIWRYRKAGMLNTVNIYGRQYISRSEIARFNARAAAGEFARIVNPRKIEGAGRLPTFWQGLRLQTRCFHPLFNPKKDEALSELPIKYGRTRIQKDKQMN